MNKVDVKYKILKEGHLPVYTHITDACADCYASLDSDITIKAGTRETVPLGFALGLPEGFKAVIYPRSGLSKKGVEACIGTIDQGYTGEVKCTLRNNSGEDFIVHEGDRICQLAVEPYYHSCPILVEDLEQTMRGDKGFGSSGV